MVLPWIHKRLYSGPQLVSRTKYNKSLQVPLRLKLCIIVNFFIYFLVESGLYLRRIIETSEINEEDNILHCQYLVWSEDGGIRVDEITYLNGENCVNTDNAEVVWTQEIDAIVDSSSIVSTERNSH